MTSDIDELCDLFGDVVKVSDTAETSSPRKLTGGLTFRKKCDTSLKVKRQRERISRKQAIGSVEMLCEARIAHFAALQEQLPKLREQLQANRRDTTLAARVRAIEIREEELLFYQKALPLAEQHKALVQQIASGDVPDAWIKEDTMGNEYVDTGALLDIERKFHAAIGIVRQDADYTSRASAAAAKASSLATSFICLDCGNTNPVVDTSVMDICEECGCEQPTCRDNEVTLTTEIRGEPEYHTIRRFRDILSKICGNGRNESSFEPDVLAKLRARAARDAGPYKDFTISDMRQYLHEIGRSDLYKDVTILLHVVCHKALPRLTEEDEAKIFDYFRKTEAVFEQARLEVNPKRKCFISHPFLLYKIAEFMDLKEIKDSCRLLQSVDKLQDTCAMWRCICDINGWVYIPT